MIPVNFGLVVEATRAEARSALPDAPVLDDPAPREARVLHTLRRSLTAALRAIATGADRAATRVERGTFAGGDLGGG